MFRIPLMKPYITTQVKDKVLEVLDSGYLTEGPVTRQLEQAIRDWIGCQYALAVTSCTTGLELALRAVGIGPGDEVIVPDFTYPATADAVAIVGATAVLVDVTPDTFLIDYDQAEEAITSRTKAILPVSEFGNPLDHERLAHLKCEYGLVVIEDAACSIGSEFKGIKTGNCSDITVFSLHPRKFITSGEGGIVTTNNSEWARWMDSYKHFGIEGTDPTGKPIFQRIGTNYKMSNLQSAVALVQMESIDPLLRQRRKLAEQYWNLFTGSSDIATPTVTEGGVHSWQSFCVRVASRDFILEQVRRGGIEVQFGAFALHMQPAFQPGPQIRWAGSLKGSLDAFATCLALPLYHDLTSEEQNAVVTAVLSGQQRSQVA